MVINIVWVTYKMKDQQNRIEPRNKSIFKCLLIFDKSVKLIQWER